MKSSAFQAKLANTNNRSAFLFCILILKLPTYFIVLMRPRSLNFIVKSSIFYIYVNLIYHRFKPLDRVINSEMLGVENDYTVLIEVKKNIFIRFIE